MSFHSLAATQANLPSGWYHIMCRFLRVSSEGVPTGSLGAGPAREHAALPTPGPFSSWVWQIARGGSQGREPGLYHWNSGGGYAASFTGSFTSSSPAVASRTGSLSHSTLMKGFSASWEALA